MHIFIHEKKPLIIIKLNHTNLYVFQIIMITFYIDINNQLFSTFYVDL